MEKLHDLIHRLSKGEKRSLKIKLNANKSSSILNSYFDILSKQKTYSFDALQKSRNQTVSLTKSSLSLLYEVILKNLVHLNGSKNEELSLRNEFAIVKILMKKGLTNSAVVSCKKLIDKAEKLEEFGLLKDIYDEYWNLYLLKGELNNEVNQKIQADLELVCFKEKEITDLRQIFRNLTTIYYNYFFKKRDESYLAQVRNLTKDLIEKDFLSDKAKVIYYEIKSIEHNLHNDLESLHNVRTSQFKHLTNSSVFDTEHLLKLMVFSNLFVKLKSQALINELNAHLDFMEGYFSELISKNSDHIISEKYYDIYFSNACYSLVWSPNEEMSNKLINLFNNIVSDKLITNNLLLARIYLSLIKLLLIDGDYKLTSNLLVRFFNLLKKNKYSQLYVDGELIFLIKNVLQHKIDSIEHELEAFNRKIKRNKIELNQDQSNLLELINGLRKNKEKPVEYYIERVKNTPVYKLFIYKILTPLTIPKIIETYFSIKDIGFKKDLNDYFKRE